MTITILVIVKVQNNSLWLYGKWQIWRIMNELFEVTDTENCKYCLLLWTESKCMDIC